MTAPVATPRRISHTERVVWGAFGSFMFGFVTVAALLGAVVVIGRKLVAR